MGAKVVLDISSVVWNEQDFNTNQTPYYALASEFIIFLQAFESCNQLLFVARNELINEIREQFPYSIPNSAQLVTFKRRALQFLSSKRVVSYNINNQAICSIPNICHNYFSDTLKVEVKYLLSEMHNAENYIFCTFRTCWQNNSNLQTNNGNSNTHKTIIHEDTEPTIQDYYLKHIQNVFEHNEKHDSNKGKRKENNEWIYPLSCYDVRKKDTTIPQQLLDVAKQCGDEYYSYDTVNQTFVCFKNHQDNKYHGYDEDIENVPSQIKNTFHK